MKSPPAASADDCDDIFGPPRTYPTGYCPPKSRPSMISAKYRQKEERRKVLKISINKLKKIEDPEASLCRSVLINNTMKRLQKEARDEKVQKQQLNYPRCYDNDNLLNIKSEFIKNENKNTANFVEDETQEFTTSDSKLIDSLKVDFVVENDFDTKLAEEINTVTMGKTMEVFNGLEDSLNLDNFANSGNLDSATPTVNNTTTTQPVAAAERFTRKRSFDDMEDCDVQDVLSQFYMPPTPRMLTCIDEDEEVNVEVDVVAPSPKRLKMTDDVNPQQETFEPSKVNDNNSNNVVVDIDKVTTRDKSSEDFSVNSFINNNLPTESRLRYSAQNETDSNSFSCGHASMFNELQSNVYHNLIASLET